MRNVWLYDENQKHSLSLNEEKCFKIKICKENFENITVFSSSVAHGAVLVTCERPFVFIESVYPNAVNIKVAESLRSTKPISSLPLYFGSVFGDSLCLRAVRSAFADATTCMHILLYLASIDRAEYGRDYRYCGGTYRVEKSLLASAARTQTTLD